MANPEDLGRYRLKRLLGRGILGEVWEANDEECAGAKVALKIMHAADDELIAARIHFAREARLASLFRHPHVAAIQDAGEAAGTSFLVMELVEGRSLRAVLGDAAADADVAADADANANAATLDDKLRWIREISAGLEAMHRAGIAHRDVKPENVIVRADRSACLVDLGICKWSKFELGGERDPDEPFEPRPEPAMPPEYVPPETKNENIYDELGDQYAWGVLAYEVLTGELPHEDAPPLAERKGIPRGAAEAIDRARSSQRTQRWEAMSDVVAKLAADAARPAAAAGKTHNKGSGDRAGSAASTLRRRRAAPRSAGSPAPGTSSSDPAPGASARTPSAEFAVPSPRARAQGNDVPAAIVAVAVVFIALTMAVLFGLR